MSAHTFAANLRQASERLSRADWSAWSLYEGRRDVLPAASLPPIREPAEWDGSDPSGLRIAVVAEQGFGDQIMFGRYLGELAARGAEVVIALGAGNLTSFFDAAGYETTSVLVGGRISHVDAWCYFGSLPLKLGLLAPPPPAYLDVELSSGGGIGIVAGGSPLHPNDRNRSLPPEAAKRLRTLGRDLAPQATGCMTFLDTARLIAGLDLIVSVDTAVVHLCGAMGKRCWVLLPYDGLDWRWNDGRRSVWYPSMRLFRQPASRDWMAVLDDIELTLAARGGVAPPRP